MCQPPPPPAASPLTLCHKHRVDLIPTPSFSHALEKSELFFCSCHQLIGGLIGTKCRAHLSEPVLSIKG